MKKYADNKDNIAFPRITLNNLLNWQDIKQPPINEIDIKLESETLVNKMKALEQKHEEDLVLHILNLNDYLLATKGISLDKVLEALFSDKNKKLIDEIRDTNSKFLCKDCDIGKNDCMNCLPTQKG